MGDTPGRTTTAAAATAAAKPQSKRGTGGNGRAKTRRKVEQPTGPRISQAADATLEPVYAGVVDELGDALELALQVKVDGPPRFVEELVWLVEQRAPVG